MTTKNDAKPTVEEAIESLTGYDEVAIEKHFGKTWEVLADTRPAMFTRALVLAHELHTGAQSSAAVKTAMQMNIKALNEYFDDDTEPMPDEPVTESGKDA